MPDRITDVRFSTANTGVTRIFMAIILAGIAGIFSLASAVAQDDIAGQISAELIYPESISPGETFTLYAFISNNSNKSLYLEVMSTERRFGDFNYRSVVLPIRTLSLFEPGESRYVPAARLYYAGETLNSNDLVIDDLALRYSEPDQNLVTAPRLPLPTMLITVEDLDSSQNLNPALFPIPNREPLQIKDLADVGDELLIHDPNTGFDWIQLGETLELSLQDVEYALATNPNLQGFQLARGSQVIELLLNHIHAAGLAAQRNDLGISSVPDNLAPTIADFVDLFGPSQTLRGSRYINGAVADEPVLPVATDLPYTGGVRIAGHDGTPCDEFFCPALGANATNLPVDKSSTAQVPYGFWLVRGAVELSRPSDRVSFLDGQLVIPSLKIDGAYYRAALSLLDRDLNLFAQIALATSPATNNAVEFDNTTQLLQIPDAVLMELDGSEIVADLTFRLIPDTMPPVLELIGISE